MLEIEKSLVFVIDVQEKLLNAVYNKNVLEKNAIIVSKAADMLEIPVIVTEQYPKGLGETIKPIKVALQKALYYEKTDFNAFNVKSIEDSVKNYDKNQVVIMGIESHICVYQTALGFLENGFEVTVISNASGSRSEYEHENSINVLRQEGVKIKTVEMVLFEWLRTSRHNKFKEIQNLIK